MKNVVGFALISELWKDKQFDVISSLMHVFCTVVLAENIFEIRIEGDKDMIIERIKERFGIPITKFVLVAIVNKAIDYGVIQSVKCVYHVIKDEAVKYTLETKAEEDKIEKVIDDVHLYMKTTYQIDANKEEILDKLFNILNDPECITRITSEEDNGIEIEIDKISYIIAEYIELKHSKDDTIYNSILHIYLGITLARGVKYFGNDSSSRPPKLDNIKICCDTKFLYGLLGFYGDYRKEICIELIEKLKELGARLEVYSHTISEMRYQIDSAAAEIESGTFNPSKSSEVCIHLKNSKLDPTAIRLFSTNLPEKLSNAKVGKSKKPEVSAFYLHQPNRKELARKIALVYGHSTEHLEGNKLVQNDVNSVIYTIVKRGEANPRKLSEVQNLFLTINNGLIRASRNYQRYYLHNKDFPYVVADWYLGTYIWISDPVQVAEIGRKNIMCSCMSMMKPTKAFYKKVMNTAEELQKDDRITDAEYHIVMQEKFNEYYLKRMVSKENYISTATLSQSIEDYTNEKVVLETSRLRGEMKSLKSENDTLKDENSSLKPKKENVPKILSSIIILIIFGMISFILSEMFNGKTIISKYIQFILVFISPSGIGLLLFRNKLSSFLRKKLY